MRNPGLDKLSPNAHPVKPYFLAGAAAANSGVMGVG